MDKNGNFGKLKKDVEALVGAEIKKAIEENSVDATFASLITVLTAITSSVFVSMMFGRIQGLPEEMQKERIDSFVDLTRNSLTALIKEQMKTVEGLQKKGMLS